MNHIHTNIMMLSGILALALSEHFNSNDYTLGIVGAITCGVSIWRYLRN